MMSSMSSRGLTPLLGNTDQSKLITQHAYTRIQLTPSAKVEPNGRTRRGNNVRQAKSSLSLLPSSRCLELRAAEHYARRRIREGRTNPSM
jgi:hypothetical protein